MNIAVTGSIAFDYLMAFDGRFSDHFLPDKLDSISVSFLVDSLKKQKGGCGANISYNTALLGETPYLIGAAGPDITEYRQDLENAGVNTSGIKIFDAFTSSFFGNTDLKGNQICSFYSGAMQHAAELSLKALDDVDIELAIVAPNDPEAMLQFAQECRDLKLPFIFDPGQQTVSLEGEDLIKGCTGARLMILNDYEVELFKRKTNLDDARLLELCEVVIVTLGENGSEIRTRSEGTVIIPVAKADPIADPTGVGDAYRAGLMKGMVNGLPWEISGRMGSLAAVYVLETDGPQNHHYNLQTFIDRYNETFGEDERLTKLLSNI